MGRIQLCIIGDTATFGMVTYMLACNYLTLKLRHGWSPWWNYVLYCIPRFIAIKNMFRCIGYSVRERSISVTNKLSH